MESAEVFQTTITDGFTVPTCCSQALEVVKPTRIEIALDKTHHVDPFIFM